MMESLLRLAIHLSNQRPPAKIIVWAHDSHLGDARATQMGARGELNLGQLVHEHFGKEAVSIGFTTYDGTVTAASDWDGPAERKNVRPAHPESYEALFHNVDVRNFFLDLRKDVDVAASLRNERLERAIGVIYRPDTELISHYFHRAYQINSTPSCITIILALLNHLSELLEWEMGEVEETFPSEAVNLSCLRQNFAFSFSLVAAIPRILLKHFPSRQPNSLRKPGRSTVSRCPCRKDIPFSRPIKTRTGAL